MKKTFLSFLCMAGSYMMFAQTTQNTDSLNRGTNTGTTTTTNTTTSDPAMNTNTSTTTNTDWNNNTNANVPVTNINTTTYNAYGTTSVAIPSTVSGYFERDYPGTTNVTWTQEGDFYHGTYMANGRYNHVYYNQSGASYRVSLPKAATWVPDDIISRVATAFGPMVYDVTTMRNAEGGNIYQVRVVENGQVKPHWFAEDGSVVMDPFRHDLNTEVNTGSYSGMDGNANAVTTETQATTTTDSSLNTTTTTDSSQMSSSLNTGTTTTDTMNATNNSNNNNNTDSGVTTGELNTTSSTEIKEMKIKSKDGKTKIKTKTADGKETKTKIEDGEIKVKED